MKQCRFLCGIVSMIALLAGQSDLFGCSCSASTLKEDFDHASQVFLGRVIQTWISYKVEKLNVTAEENIVTLEVLKSWKGIRTSRIQLKTNACVPCCGIAFEAGMVYLVFSGKSETSQCSGTRRASQSEETLSPLGKPIWINSDVQESTVPDEK